VLKVWIKNTHVISDKIYGKMYVYRHGECMYNFALPLELRLEYVRQSRSDNVKGRSLFRIPAENFAAFCLYIYILYLLVNVFLKEKNPVN
jgi:hypothetical protein